jgi:cytochrome P450
METDTLPATRDAICGNAPHRCPGSFLARTEIKVYLQEWLARIPDFTIEPGALPIVRTGVNGSFHHLPLSWSVAQEFSAA